MHPSVQVARVPTHIACRMCRVPPTRLPFMSKILNHTRSIVRGQLRTWSSRTCTAHAPRYASRANHSYLGPEPLVLLQRTCYMTWYMLEFATQLGQDQHPVVTRRCCGRMSARDCLTAVPAAAVAAADHQCVHAWRCTSADGGKGGRQPHHRCACVCSVMQQGLCSAV
jgi:hypothetical protein